MAKHLNPMAPYFVQMRELERQLLIGALAQAAEIVGPNLTDQMHFSARILGIQFAYFRVRSRYLGGVLPGEAKCEPPTKSVSESWARESVRVGPKPRRKSRAPKLALVKDPEPEPPEPEPDA
jgi:hypothetical protein